MSEMLEIKKK